MATAAASRLEAENLQRKTNCGFYRVRMLMILMLFPFFGDGTPLLFFFFLYPRSFASKRVVVLIWPSQINHKYPERRLLVAESCGALAPYLPVRTFPCSSIFKGYMEHKDGFSFPPSLPVSAERNPQLLGAVHVAANACGGQG